MNKSKKLKVIFAALCMGAMITATATACAKGVDVTLTGHPQQVEEGTEIQLSSLFSILADGKDVVLMQGMLDLGGLNLANPEAGTYTIKLTYVSSDGKTHTETTTVTVTEKVVPVVVEITTKSGATQEGEAIDCKSLFTITADGEPVSVTDEMLDVGGLDCANPAVGTYTVKLTYTATDGQIHEATATVTVTTDPVIEVVITQKNATVEVGDTLDCKTLFTVTAEGQSVEVTDSMLDLGTLDFANLVAGKHTVTLTYLSTDDVTHTASTTVTVINRVRITAKNGEITNDTSVEKLDCKTLFTITENGEKVTVTDAMLNLGSFNPNAPVVGSYTVTCTYTSADGLVYNATATVTVKNEEEFWTKPY